MCLEGQYHEIYPLPSSSFFREAIQPRSKIHDWQAEAFLEISYKYSMEVRLPTCLKNLLIVDPGPRVVGVFELSIRMSH